MKKTPTTMKTRPAIFAPSPEPDDWDTICSLCGGTEGEHGFGDWACPTKPGKFSKRYEFLPRRDFLSPHLLVVKS